MHVEAAPQAVAALRNGLISLVRGAGWKNIAAALCHFNAAPLVALQFIGILILDFDGSLGFPTSHIDSRQY